MSVFVQFLHWTYRFLEYVISGQNDGSISPLSIHDYSVNIGKFCWIQSCWPELALLEDQHPQTILEVTWGQLSWPQRLKNLISLARMMNTWTSILLPTFSLEQFGLFVFSFLDKKKKKWKCCRTKTVYINS